LWAFARAPSASSTSVVGSVPVQIDQLAAMGYDRGRRGHHAADACLAHHAQPGTGPALAAHQAPAPPTGPAHRSEAEFICNSLIGFNFGDGHLHNEDMINAVQAQARSSR